MSKFLIFDSLVVSCLLINGRIMFARANIITDRYEIVIFISVDVKLGLIHIAVGKDEEIITTGANMNIPHNVQIVYKNSEFFFVDK
jgi:hypothetical protein